MIPKRRLTTRWDRARAFAQEMVLFGRLGGAKWYGLAMLLVIFAESEIALTTQPDPPIARD